MSIIERIKRKARSGAYDRLGAAIDRSLAMSMEERRERPRRIRKPTDRFGFFDDCSKESRRKQNSKPAVKIKKRLHPLEDDTTDLEMHQSNNLKRPKQLGNKRLREMEYDEVHEHGSFIASESESEGEIEIEVNRAKMRRIHLEDDDESDAIDVDSDSNSHKSNCKETRNDGSDCEGHASLDRSNISSFDGNQSDDGASFSHFKKLHDEGFGDHLRAQRFRSVIQPRMQQRAERQRRARLKLLEDKQRAKSRTIMTKTVNRNVTVHVNNSGATFNHGPFAGSSIVNHAAPPPEFASQMNFAQPSLSFATPMRAPANVALPSSGFVPQTSAVAHSSANSMAFASAHDSSVPTICGQGEYRFSQLEEATLHDLIGKYQNMHMSYSDRHWINCFNQVVQLMRMGRSIKGGYNGDSTLSFWLKRQIDNRYDLSQLQQSLLKVIGK